MRVFKLNEVKKRAKTKFEAARLEYENAKAELKKEQSFIYEVF